VPDRPRTFSAVKDAYGKNGDLAALADQAGSSPVRDPRGRVMATWDLTLTLLADRGMHDAKPVLRTLAHCADTPIPYALVLDPAAFVETGLQSSQTVERLQAAVDVLVDYELLTRSVGADPSEPALYSVSLHPLIAEVIRAAPEVRNDRATHLSVIASGLHATVERWDSRAADHWPIYQAILPHLHSACELATTLEAPQPHLAATLIKVAAECASFAHASGFDDRFDDVVADAQPLADWLGPDHSAVLELRYAQAVIKELRGRYAESLADFDAILETQRRVSGWDHQATIRTRHYHAWTLAVIGDLAGAELEYEQLVRDCRRVHGATHINTLNAQTHLGWVLDRSGKLKAARRLITSTVKQQVQALGANHPHVFWARNTLAHIHMCSGDLAAAEAEYREVLKARARTLGNRHRRTLETRYDLAELKERQGLTSVALVRFREVHADRLQLLGEDHPQTVETLEAIKRLEAS